jgi:hypothetical protein
MINQSHHVRGPDKTDPRALTWPDGIFGKRKAPTKANEGQAAINRLTADGSAAGMATQTPRSR